MGQSCDWCIADGPDSETPPAAVGWGNAFLQVCRHLCCPLAANLTVAGTLLLGSDLHALMQQPEWYVA